MLGRGLGARSGRPPNYKVLRTTRLQVAGVGEAAVDHLGEGVEGVADVECVERCRAVDALKLLAFKCTLLVNSLSVRAV